MDAGRRIARIDYDMMNNPVRIQFTCSGGFVICPH